jgi:activator of HSP90 ATPase
MLSIQSVLSISLILVLLVRFWSKAFINHALLLFVSLTALLIVGTAGTVSLSWMLNKINAKTNHIETLSSDHMAFLAKKGLTIEEEKQILSEWDGRGVCPIFDCFGN